VGRLAGFRYREIVSRLRRLGFEFRRQAAGSHEIWANPATGRAILRQAGIDPDEFLAL
jgi:predicted RNA binding protein YcfA (HicA-like mRNA interferase family)